MTTARSAVLLIAIGAASCSVDATGPVVNLTVPCSTSAAVTGTWVSAGGSQLGPQKTTFTFTCDCVMQTSTRLLWSRIHGRQRYTVDGDKLLLESSQGRQIVGFTRDGDQLTLKWPGGDEEELKLVKASACE